MSAPKKIFVFTASGDQGGSVAQYLAKDSEFEVWGLTRNTESEKSKAMTAAGVKMVKGDMEDVSSYSLYLEGAYGAFVNADFWAKYFTNGFDGEGAGEYEFGLSSRAIEACANAGVKHIVYSTLHDISYVPHFKYKQKVSKWAESKGYPVTNLYVSHYISNLTKFPDFLKAEGEGYALQLAAPDDCPLWNFAVEQTGGWVVPIFKDPKKYIGARVDACTEKATVKEWASIISELIGKPVRTNGLTGDMYKDYSFLTKMGIPEELILNYKGFYEANATWNMKQSHEIYPDAWDTKAWAEATGALKQFS